MLDLICLIFAVPTTILYELIGSELLQPNEPPQAPFSASDVTTIQSQGLPWPAITNESQQPSGQMKASGTGLSAELQGTLGICSAFFQMVSASFVVASDTLAWESQQEEDDKPNAVATLLSLVSVIPRLAVFGTGVPVGLLQKPRDQWSDADQWTMWLWCARGSAILIDFIFTAVSIKKAEAKWGPTYGPALKTTMAVGLEAVGSVAAYYQLNDSNYSDWVPANDWARPAAGVFKWLLYFGPETPAWAPIPWLLGIDVVGGIGSGVTQSGAAVYQYQHSN